MLEVVDAKGRGAVPMLSLLLSRADVGGPLQWCKSGLNKLSQKWFSLDDFSLFELFLSSYAPATSRAL